MEKILLDLKSIAEMLCVSTRTVHRLKADGKIRLYRIGGKLFAKRQELLEDIEQIAERV
jgi:excisionase family DNA binding protein